MNGVLLHCTSWVGECTEAEHFYCRIGEYPEDALEELCSRGVCPINGVSFRYTPTEEQALALARKDNYRGGGTKIRSDADDYIEDGVTRFWSLHQICEEAHKKFPDKKLYGFFESHRGFCRWYRKESETGKYQPQDFVVLKY